MSDHQTDGQGEYVGPEDEEQAKAGSFDFEAIISKLSSDEMAPFVDKAKQVVNSYGAERLAMAAGISLTLVGAAGSLYKGFSQSKNQGNS